ncbi:unnamed protein product [Triticum turgidum subsp. durum]|uniref:non-specific serine/threonine protein kinase n=1 Tax=Triticum turgidum subsp. durum TaxID=4567 RepID=A0A9R0SR98_TRITD|nr:unnamed protein product [Triticum turgidum subsp. durum]
MATAASRARSSILISVCAGCFLLLCLSRDAAASPLSFSFDFSNKSTFGSRIQVMGDALQQDNLVDLTVDTSYRRGIHYLKGRMSYVDPVPFFDGATHELTSFVTQFTFAIKPIQGEIRGDGMAFFLSSFPPTVPVNSTGGNLGLIVQGDGNALGVDRFVAIVFKTFNNSDHIGIDINSASSSKNETALPDFSLNGSMTACITFNGTTGMMDASLQLNDNRSLGPFKVSYQLPDPMSLLPPEVAVGFSAGTGDYSERHQIMSWSFTTTLPQRKGQTRKATRNALLIIAACSIVLVAGIIVLLRRRCLFPDRQSIQLGSLGPRQFSPRQLKRATNNFSHLLGKGAFGLVYKGTLEDKEVAVKKLSRRMVGVGATDFGNEARLLMAIKHKNLVKLLGYCNRGENRLLCLEYLSGGSLDKLIYAKTPGGGGLDWCARYQVVQGICSGLQYLHHELDPEQRIVHMDLKASNVLISRNERGDITNVKIADFGLSKLFRADLTHSYTELVIGLKAYMAPEYLSRGRISAKVDIYCFGVLILEIVTGDCANVNDSSVEFIDRVSAGRRSSCAQGVGQRRREKDHGGKLLRRLHSTSSQLHRYSAGLHPGRPRPQAGRDRDRPAALAFSYLRHSPCDASYKHRPNSSIIMSKTLLY